MTRTQAERLTSPLAFTAGRRGSDLDVAILHVDDVPTRLNSSFGWLRERFDVDAVTDALCLGSAGTGCLAMLEPHRRHFTQFGESSSDHQLTTHSVRRESEFRVVGSEQLECIFVFRDQSAPTLAEDGRRVRLLLQDLTRLGAEFSVPIGFGVSPVSPPTEEEPTPSGLSQQESEQARWRRSARSGVRIAWAVGSALPRSILEFQKRLIDTARDHTCNLYINSRHRTGRYGWVRTYPISDLQGEPSQHPPSPGGVQSTFGLTVVGPARIGSSSKALEILNSVGAGVVGWNVSVLGSLAVMHFVLTSSLPASGGDNSPLVKDIKCPATTPLATWIRDRIEDLGGRHSATEAPSEPRDHPNLAGYSASVSRLRATPARTNSTLRALWLSWEVPFSARSFVYVVDGLSTAFRSITGGNPNLAYLVSRASGDGVVRGRAKAVVDPLELDNWDGHPDLPRDRAEWENEARIASSLCSSVEDEWQADLTRRLGDARVQTRVVWRERWISSRSGLFE